MRRRERFIPVYICPHEGCARGQKDFWSKNHLYQHYLIHVHLNAMCNACDMQFNSLATLVRHSRSCGDDFFSSSPHDAKTMVDLIVSCRRKLEEHVSERLRVRRTKRAADREIRQKSPTLNENDSGGQESHSRIEPLSPEVSPGSKSDIETITSEAPICEPTTKMPNRQPHRWIPDLIFSGVAHKLHLFEDYTCPHGECSSRKKDWRTKEKLLHHFYSHFSCAAICNICNKNIGNLRSLVVHIDWCKGFLNSSPRAVRIRAELMKLCGDKLNNKLAERFKAGTTVGERDAQGENSKSQWNYLISCTMDPKLPFPKHNLSEVQDLADNNVHLPSEDLPAPTSDARSNGLERLQPSCHGDLALVPNIDASSALCPNDGELPEVQQSLGRYYYDVHDITDPPFQRGSQQAKFPKIHHPTRDASVFTQHPSNPSLGTNQQALPVDDVSSFDRASLDAILDMGPDFYSQWSTELCEPQTWNGTEMSQALFNPATNLDPDLSLELVNNAYNAFPGDQLPMNQAQLPPTANLDINSPLPLAIPTERGMCLPTALDRRKASFCDQPYLNGALFDSSILMDPTLCLQSSGPIPCNCAIHALQACFPGLKGPILDDQ